MHMTASVRETR